MEKKIKKIKFNDVIDFIYKSIKKEYYIKIENESIEIGHEMKYISNNGGEHIYNYISFSYFIKDDCLTLYVDKFYVPNNKDFYYCITTEDQRDLAIWTVLIEDIKDYMFNRIENKFDSFFNEDNSKLKNADDLDDDED